MILTILIGIRRLFFLDRVYDHSDQVRNRFGAQKIKAIEARSQRAAYQRRFGSSDS